MIINGGVFSEAGFTGRLGSVLIDEWEEHLEKAVIVRHFVYKETGPVWPQAPAFTNGDLLREERKIGTYTKLPTLPSVHSITTARRTELQDCQGRKSYVAITVFAQGPQGSLSRTGCEQWFLPTEQDPHYVPHTTIVNFGAGGRDLTDLAQTPIPGAFRTYP